jgi:predicted transcriptional regulator YheO
VSPDTEEIFGSEIGDVLDGMVQQAVSRVGIPVSAMTRDDKVAVIRILDKKGAFLVKRAIDRIARVLRVSRVTAYAYLEEARAWPDGAPSDHFDGL